MGIILNKNIPILQTPAQQRRKDVLRGMCRYVTSRHKVERAATEQLMKNLSRGK